MSELECLIGRHVFVRYFEPTRQTVLKGRVLKVNKSKVMLELTGNGSDIPDGPLTVPEANLLLNPFGGNEYFVLEEHGDIPGLGQWTDNYQDVT